MLQKNIARGNKPIFNSKKGKIKANVQEELSCGLSIATNLEVELNRMQKGGILEPVENSEWATLLVVVPTMNDIISGM